MENYIKVGRWGWHWTHFLLLFFFDKRNKPKRGGAGDRDSIISLKNLKHSLARIMNKNRNIFVQIYKITTLLKCFDPLMKQFL